MCPGDVTGGKSRVAPGLGAVPGQALQGSPPRLVGQSARPSAVRLAGAGYCGGPRFAPSVGHAGVLRTGRARRRADSAAAGPAAGLPRAGGRLFPWCLCRGAAGPAQGAGRGLGAGRGPVRRRQAAQRDPGARRGADAGRDARLPRKGRGLHADADARDAAAGDPRAGAGRRAVDAQGLPPGRGRAGAHDRRPAAGDRGLGRAGRSRADAGRAGGGGGRDLFGGEGAGEERRHPRGGKPARHALPRARPRLWRQGPDGGPGGGGGCPA